MAGQYKTRGDKKMKKTCRNCCYCIYLYYDDIKHNCLKSNINSKLLKIIKLNKKGCCKFWRKSSNQFYKKIKINRDAIIKKFHLPSSRIGIFGKATKRDMEFIKNVEDWKKGSIKS